MIKVYSKPMCVQCEFTKRFLMENQVDFLEVDVTENEDAMNDLKHAGFKRLLVVALGNLDYAFSGFQPDRLSELVEGGAKC